MEALRLSPVGLPVTDVLTGLQTGLLDVIAAPPVGVIALQWHTRVKYMTATPLMYTMGLMAVDAGAFGKLGPADQQAFREVMEAVYGRLDHQSRADDQAAQAALKSSGIRLVDAQAGEVESWRGAMAEANRRLGADGVYSPSLLAELEGLLKEFRQRRATAAAAGGP
jgi:TRAP-type C4-dicarboxylate transport system substrate-binding protein